MQDFTIRVEDDAVKYAVEIFFDNAKDGMATFINNFLRNEHGACDAAVLKGADGVYEIYKTAPDKGWVLGEQDGSLLQLQKYTEVAEGDLYVCSEGEKLTLYIKEPAGQPDLKIGHFPTINIAAEQIGSKDVEHGIEQAIARRDNARKEDAKLERAEKLHKLAKNETTPVTENAE